jgi:starch phosphorylase
MSRNWHKIAIKNVEIPVSEAELFVGQKLSISIDVNLGEISPDDVRIELVSGRLNAQEEITRFIPIVLNQSTDKTAPQNGVYAFTGEVTLAESGRFGISARIIPKSDVLPHTIRPKLISWW